MNELFLAIRQFLLGLRPWVAVTPWEQAIRVRAGKHIKLLATGMHWKLPILDVVFLQSTRLRVSSFGYGRQTVTTSDGTTLTFCGAVAYSILDIEKLYRTLHHAEDTLQCLARGELARFVATRARSECSPSEITRCVGASLATAFSDYGLGDVALYLSDYAIVRTYRVIGDAGSYGSGPNLDTSTPVTRMT